MSALAVMLAAPPDGASASPAPCITSLAVVFPGRPLPSGMGETERVVEFAVGLESGRIRPYRERRS